jgi:hypothetical protein
MTLVVRIANEGESAIIGAAIGDSKSGIVVYRGREKPQQN